ncbi:MAG: hypothetical protein HC774_03070 [Sphingomonadales bacterium]|nr:hypothetical protein [Sphingomonadales bacterium]
MAEDSKYPASSASGLPRIKRQAAAAVDGLTLSISGAMTPQDIDDLRRIGTAIVLQPKGWRANIAQMLFAAIYAGGTIFVVSLFTTTTQALWAAAGALFVGAVIAKILESAQLSWSRRLSDTADTPVSFTIAPDGFHYAQEHYESRMAWAALTKVTVEPNWLIISFGAITTYGIPTHMFASVEERRLWVDALNAYLPAAARVEYLL